MLLGSDEVETLMEIHLRPKARLVDVEEMSQPGTEEADQRRVRIREDDGSFPLGALTRVERNAPHQELSLAQLADSLQADAVALFDLAELALVCWMWAAARAVPALAGGEGDVADPDGDAGLGDAELVGDLLQGLVLRAEAAGVLLLALLAAVPHVRTVPMGCDTDVW